MIFVCQINRDRPVPIFSTNTFFRADYIHPNKESIPVGCSPLTSMVAGGMLLGVGVWSWGYGPLGVWWEGTTPPSLDRMTHTCEYNTFPQLAGGKYSTQTKNKVTTLWE